MPLNKIFKTDKIVNMFRFLYAQSNKQDGNFSLRYESEEIVLPKREDFLTKHGISSRDCVFIQTEHEEKITHVGGSDKGRVITTEALITKESGVILYLLTADCFPVSFYDSKSQIVALAHMGWKPTDKELALKVVNEMKSTYGSQPQDIEIIIGPGIHKESYKFINPVQKQMPNWTAYLTDLEEGETQIDLISYIKDQVVRGGVPQENIQINSIDTATSKNYFSHYRAVRTGEPEGRFATIIGLL